MASTVLVQSINCAQLTCEWKNCHETFTDRFNFLTHITRAHIAPFNEKETCEWEGCDGWEFDQMEHLQLHLSIHAYHHQIMHVGYKIMTCTKPALKCYQDPSSRNIIADLSNVLLCGWKDCNAEFFNYELFTLHVDTHAMEDVAIPVISKDLLKTVKFAKCEWVGCDASFKSKSHLKSHLMSHTQKKLIACPICGLAFCTKAGFLNHCYRQDTPTSVKNQHIANFEEDLDEDPEVVLTIDEDANPASIVLHFQPNLQNIIPAHAIISHQNGELKITTDHSTTVNSAPVSEQPIDGSSLLMQKAAKSDQLQVIPSVADGNCPQIVLVNLNLTEANSGPNPSGSVMGTAVTGNIIQQLLVPEEGEREFRCTLCPKSFCTKSLLREHANKHVRKYRCKKCPYAAPYPARLKEHEQYRHSENRDYNCKMCDQTFKTKYSCRRHEVTHGDEPEQNVCKVCHQLFTNYYSLNRHIRLAHLNEQIIFACHMCEKEYNRGNNLSRHLTGTHQLKPSNGWSRFVYEKQDDGIFRLKLITAIPQENSNYASTFNC